MRILKLVPLMVMSHSFAKFVLVLSLDFGLIVLTPKFDKLSLEKKRSADDVESKKNLLIKVYLRASQGIFFKIFGDA